MFDAVRKITDNRSRVNDLIGIMLLCLCWDTCFYLFGVGLPFLLLGNVVGILLLRKLDS